MSNSIKINHENMQHLVNVKNNSMISQIDLEENNLSDSLNDLMIKNDNFSNQIELVQWVNSIEEIKSSSNLKKSLVFLNEILGPIDFNDLKNYLDNDNINKNDIELNHMLNKTDGNDLSTQIIFKINEKVFIDEINIYERSFIKDAFIVKIEVLNEKNNAFDEIEWYRIWHKKSLQYEVKPNYRIFTPKIEPILFKTNKLRITLNGSLYLINAIEIKGKIKNIEQEFNKYLRFDEKKENEFANQFTELILNYELFADVLLEVDGKIIPAHKNILSCRCEYFKKLLKESNMTPIYIKNISYVVFLELLNYLYSGNVKIAKISYFDILDLIKVSNLMNLLELQKFCLFHLSQILNTDNVIQIYKEILTNNQNLDIFTNLIDLCYDIITLDFKSLSKTQEFCSLSQDLLIKIIETVFPRFNILKLER